MVMVMVMVTLRCTSLAAQQGRMMVLFCHRRTLSSSSSSTTTTRTTIAAAAATSMVQQSFKSNAFVTHAYDDDDDGSGTRLKIHHPHQQQQHQLLHPCRSRRCRHNNNNNFLHSVSFSTISSSSSSNNNYDDDDDVDHHYDEDSLRPPPNNQQRQRQDHHHHPRIDITPGGGTSSKTNKLKKKKRVVLSREQDRPFRDRIQLQTRGGSGGFGCISYHRIGSYKKRPCGGHGGTGGNVYLVVDSTLNSLTMPKRHFFGQDGSRGGVNGRNGKNGRHVYVRVPQGVIVRRVLDYEETQEEVKMKERVMKDRSESEEGDAVGDRTVLMGKGFIAPEEEEGDKNDSDSEYDDDDDDDDENQYFEFHTHELEGDDVDHDHDSDGNDNESDDEYSDEEENEFINQSINAHEEKEEEEDDFDTQYKRMLSTKRSRRRRGVAGGSSTSSTTPSDYNDVVNQGVRAEDGMFYWSSPDTMDGSERQMMASMDYDDNSDDSYPTRKTVFLADLDQPQSTLLVAQGGKAGVGNQAYANRPYFSNMEANAAKKAIPGMGECTYLELELKLIADVGLVGFPNAGKSSLLSAMSRAKPKIASYPFTTLHPLVGSIQYRDGLQIVMADVPGLIEGAAGGRGRGIEFLRHIERTKALVYMVDGAGVDGRDPVSDLKVLGNELREYGSSGIFGNEIGGEGGYEEEMRRRRREIMNRPSLILANKMDLIPEVDATMGRREEILFQLSQAAQDAGIACDRSDIIGISAGVTGEGLRVLSKQLRLTVLGM